MMPFRTVKLSYIDVCARFHLDAWSKEAPERLRQLVVAGLVRQVSGSKAAVGKVLAAGMPEEAAASWLVTEHSQEVVKERAAQSTYMFERSFVQNSGRKSKMGRT